MAPKKTAHPKKKPSTLCLCGSGTNFNQCCGPLLRRQQLPETAEQLMRSRYVAFAKRNAEYLRYSWHPDHVPPSIGNLPSEGWEPLVVVSVLAGGPDDDTGTVEFRSGYSHGDHGHDIHEISRFGRHEGRWVYLDGVVPNQ